jgi:hypothetical protein
MQFDDAALQGSLLDASPVIRAEIWGQCLRDMALHRRLTKRKWSAICLFGLPAAINPSLSTSGFEDSVE